MPVTVTNPYSGEPEQTCSVSFAAQQKLAETDVSGKQTEAEFNLSKQLGEWGVIVAKLKQGEIPKGTKLLTFEAPPTIRGFLKSNGKSQPVLVKYDSAGKKNEYPVDYDFGEDLINAKMYKTAIPQAVQEPAKKESAPTVAAAVASPSVTPGSTSPGSMTHEDVAALFVKVKDDLAKEKGLNIKGANPELDQVVYQAIGDGTGYTAAEVKAKIDAYKATGAKLSALKKKVLAGTKKVPDLNKDVKLSEPAKDFKPLPKPDPKPNDVPTMATTKLKNEIKEEVKKEAEAKPTKVYSNEDVAAQYIIAKDKVVAESGGKWTLYSKSDEMDKLIASQVEQKTGFTAQQQKQAIAEYLASGKKLSQLKKALAKQGAFTPQADTLKSGPSKKSLADKEKEVSAKADAGYTPTPTPSAGTPPTDTGKPAPKRVEREAEQSGDISDIPASVRKLYFDKFKATGSKSWLSSGPASNYDGFLQVQKEMQLYGHSKNVTLLQIIRVVDEEGAKKTKVANGKLFEKQVATWLTTPEGTAYIKTAEEKALQAAQAAAVAAKKAEEAAKLAAELAKKAKEMEANQPPLPADSAQYQPWDLDKARRISRTWLDREPWTAKQQRDLKHYTGSAYTEMNGYLRGRNTSISDRSKTAIDGAKEGMRPTTEPILVSRGTGLSQFSSLGITGGYGSNDGDLLFGAVGKTFKDEGFLSTSAGGRAAFGGAATLEIECPVGTPMAYVAPISKYPHENEMLLQAGMEYQILHTRKENGRYVVRMRVVNWPGKGA